MLATYMTSKMMAQLLFESVCNCLGSPAHPGKPASRTWPEGTSDSQEDTIASSDGKRRSSRLELRHEEWDGLFSRPRKASSRRTPPPTKSSSQRKSRTKPSKSPPPRKSSSDSDKQESENVEADVHKGNADNKQRAPSRRRRSKSRGKSPDTIFRKRRSVEQSKKQNVSPPSSFSKFLSNHQVVNALCFATPVRDDEDDDMNSVVTVTSDGSSAANTLNTAGEDDTIMFEVKYGSRNRMNRREPMMLFPQYKVEDEKDELRRIVATDSHKSLTQD